MKKLAIFTQLRCWIFKSDPIIWLQGSNNIPSKMITEQSLSKSQAIQSDYDVFSWFKNERSDHLWQLLQSILHHFIFYYSTWVKGVLGPGEFWSSCNPNYLCFCSSVHHHGDASPSWAKILMVPQPDQWVLQTYPMLEQENCTLTIRGTGQLVRLSNPFPPEWVCMTMPTMLSPPFFYLHEIVRGEWGVY